MAFRIAMPRLEHGELAEVHRLRAAIRGKQTAQFELEPCRLLWRPFPPRRNAIPGDEAEQNAIHTNPEKRPPVAVAGARLSAIFADAILCSLTSLQMFGRLYAFAFVPLVAGHAVLTRPEPRLGTGLPGQGTKLTPASDAKKVADRGCGGTDNADPGIVQPEVVYINGSTIAVQWSLTIPHEEDNTNMGVRVAIHYAEGDSFNDNARTQPTFHLAPPRARSARTRAAGPFGLSRRRKQMQRQKQPHQCRR